MNDRKCLRTPTNVWQSPCDHCELVANCIRKPIHNHILLSVRATLTAIPMIWCQSNIMSANQHILYQWCCLRITSFRQLASWVILGPVKADTLHSGRPMNNDLPQCDVSDFTGPSIQKATFNQSELVQRSHQFAEWPLDMYLSVGHVSPCTVWYCNKQVPYVY